MSSETYSIDSDCCVQKEPYYLEELGLFAK